MTSLNINSDEQLIKISSIKRMGVYFNIFCFNRSKHKSSTYKGAKSGNEVLEFINSSCQQGLISESSIKGIDFNELIEKLKVAKDGEDINIEI